MEEHVCGTGPTMPCGKSLAEIVTMPPNGEIPPPGEEAQPIAKHGRLIVVGLALGAMAELMLYQNSLGIGVPLFAICGVVGLIAAGHWEAKEAIRWRNVTPLAASVIFFAAMIAVRGGGIITAINVAVCLRLGTLLLGMFTRCDILQIGVGDLIGIPWRILGKMAAGSKPVLSSLDIPESDARQRLLLPAGRGLLLALPILVVVIGLFSSADTVFAERVGEAARWLFPADYWDRIGRIAFTLIVAWSSIGGFAYAVSRSTESRDPMRPFAAPGFTEAMTVLALVNAVFLSFVIVQFDYLFNGAHRVSTMSPSMYTDYVHGGFAQLICVAVISVLLISALCAAVPPVSLEAKRRSILNGSGAVLLGLTLVILFSAAQRMSAYESAYGATAMRTYVDDAILGVALVLLWRGATLYANRAQTPSFGAGVLACLVGFGIAVNLQNPEAAAVQKNLARYRATGKVDNHFFSQSISVDAVHSACVAFRATDGEIRQTIGAQLTVTRDELRSARHSDRWPSWHAGRASALHELEATSGALPGVERSGQ